MTAGPAIAMAVPEPKKSRTERGTHHDHGHLSVGQRTLQGARSGGPRCSVAAGIVVVGHEGAFRQYALGA